MSKYRVGVIGCGRIAQTHSNAYQAIPSTEIVAAAETDVERREQAFLALITTLGVLWGLALKVNGISFAIVSFAPYFLIIIYTVNVSINSSHIICIGTYIRHFIEREYGTALHWQTAWNERAQDAANSKGYWYTFCRYASLGTCVGATLLAFIGDSLKLSSIPMFPRILLLITFTGTHCFLWAVC